MWWPMMLRGKKSAGYGIMYQASRSSGETGQEPLESSQGPGERMVVE
jgi:hypothetical protein